MNCWDPSRIHQFEYCGCSACGMSFEVILMIIIHIIAIILTIVFDRAAKRSRRSAAAVDTATMADQVKLQSKIKYHLDLHRER